MNEKKQNALQNELFDWAQNIAVILTVVVLLFTFVLRVIGVEGPSMMNTLHDGDWLLVSDLFYEPENGDIVIIKKEEFMQSPIVKRIIATEGQTVNIDFDAGRVWVDNVPIEEPYVNGATNRAFDMTFPQTVPEGCVFVLGDNRNHSSDSRTLSLGMVDERHIIGKVIFRILPVNAFGLVD